MVFNSGKITLKENLKPFVPNAPLLFPMHPFVPKPFVPNLPLKTSYGFPMFSGRRKGVRWERMGWNVHFFRFPFQHGLAATVAE